MLPNVFGKILKFLPAIIGMIGNLSKKTAKAEAVNEKSSAEDVSKMIDLFEDCKKEMLERTHKVEVAVYDEVSSYIEEVYDCLEDHQKVLKKYSIKKKKIEREVGKLPSTVQGVMEGEINRRLTLSDRELQGIIRMLPGQKKETALQEFYGRTLEQALERCNQKVREISADLYEIMEEELLERMEQIGHVWEQACESLEQLKNTGGSMTEESGIVKGIQMISAVDMTETLLGED